MKPFEPARYPDVPAKTKPFKTSVNRLVLFILGRALQSLSRADDVIQQEVRTWPEDLAMVMLIQPDNGQMGIQRTSEGKLNYLGSQTDPEAADVVIYIKNTEAAFKMLTGQMGTDVAYARHCIAARGDISLTVSITRVLNRVETYLFPAFLARRLMKRLPEIPFFKKQILRLKAYFLGIPFGL
jgi:hypothetical protein